MYVYMCTSVYVSECVCVYVCLCVCVLKRNVFERINQFHFLWADNWSGNGDHINDIDLETNLIDFSRVKLCVERGTTMSSTIDLQAMASSS